MAESKPSQKVCFVLSVTTILVYVWLFETENIKAVVHRYIATNDSFAQYEKPARPYRGASGELSPFVQEMTQKLKEQLAMPNDAPVKRRELDCAITNKREMNCSRKCDRHLSPDPGQRLKSLLEFRPLNLTDAERENILEMGRGIPENDFIIITASSSNHFEETQAMFHNLHTLIMPMVENLSVVLFDIGLSRKERELAQKKCRCQVIVFPKDKFPTHVANNYCYSWKPLIELAAFPRARKALIYQDGSIRWTKRFPELLDRVMKFGLQMFRDDYAVPVPRFTVKRTFEFMRVKPCTFLSYPEMIGSIRMYRNDDFNRKVLVERLAKCALERSCNCPPGLRMCRSKLMHGCHRFDQSALTLVLARVYATDMYKILGPHYYNHLRHHGMPNYLNSTK